MCRNTYTPALGTLSLREKRCVIVHKKREQYIMHTNRLRDLALATFFKGRFWSKCIPAHSFNAVSRTSVINSKSIGIEIRFPRVTSEVNIFLHIPSIPFIHAGFQSKYIPTHSSQNVNSRR